MKYLEAFVRAEGHAGPLAYYHLRNRRDASPLLDWLMAVIDHVDAISSGGAHTEANFVTSCNKCNGRKSATPSNDFRKRIAARLIKGKYGEPQHWDGLVSVFQILAPRMPTITATERDWLAALQDKAMDQGEQAEP